MATVASSSVSYCPVDEFLKRIDERTVRQLASDNDKPLSGGLTSNANILAALKDASGLLESAALRGEKYSSADLTTLAATDTVGRSLLYRIVSDLAWVFLWERRPNKAAHQDPPPSYERSLAWLDELTEGKKIFPLQENMDAGKFDHSVVTAEEVLDRDGMVTQAARYYGVRANRGGR